MVALRYEYYLSSFGLPRPWGGPRKSARTCNGLATVTRASSFGLGREGTLRSPAGGLLAFRTAWSGGFVFFFSTPTPRSSSLRRDGYITAESATSEAGGVERLATAWVCMHDRKYGSVGVGWDGCTQPTETKARTGLQNGEPLSP